MKVIAFIVFLILIHFSCNNSDEIKIGFLMGTTNSSRWEKDMSFFEQKVKELKGVPIIRKSEGDEQKQLLQAIELIEMDVKVLVVVASNVNTAAAIVREAHKKNIRVIAYDRLIRNCDLDFFVGFDNIHSGKLQAGYALARKPRGNYIMICGDKGDMNALFVEQGQMSELKPKLENGDVKLVYKSYIEGWSPDEARQEMERVIKLHGKEIDAVLTANDGTASGANLALEKFGLSHEIIITGMDAELDACKRIVHNKQSMTVYSPIKDLAYTSASLAMQLARKNKPDYKFIEMNNGRKEVQSIVLKPILVDAANMESTIIKDGVYSKEDIYN